MNTQGIVSMTTFSVIDINTWTSGWRLLFFAGAAVPALMGISLTIYIYKKHLPEILECFGSSPAIQTAAALARRQGPCAKGFFISYVYGSIKNPKKLIERGWVSAHDIQNFPNNIKTLLRIDHALALTFIFWIATGCLLISIRGDHTS